MSDTSDPTGVSRRSVLRKAGLASGAALVGGTAMAGNAAGSPRTNFAYVGSDIDKGDEVTLKSQVARPNLNCNDAGANIRTTAWSVSGDNEKWYFIPNGYKVGDTVKVTNENVTGCADSDLADKEVQVTKIET